MNILRDLLFMIGITISGVAACNYTDGECYPRGAGYGSEGVGGTTTVSGGAGGFGDVPLKPQTTSGPPPPECNIATQSPCNEKCEADYESAAAGCANIAFQSQRITCQNDAYEAYKSCREACQREENQNCDQKYQICVDYGPISCLKNSGGKSLCQRCWERCNAGDSPSWECRKCKF
jgi:hypothetical protein